MSSFETFVRGELPNRPVLLTVDNTDGFDDDPNDEGAPSIITGSPVGTFYARESPVPLFYRKVAPDTWILVGSDSSVPPEQITYVDVAGDDDAPGTEDDPIATLEEASRRTSQKGKILQLQFGAGTFRLPNYSAEAFYGPRVSFGSSQSYLQMIGTMTPSVTFTVASSTGISITATGSPGWTVNEHVGKLAAITNFGQVFYHPVISNTADTIVINIGSSGIGGFFSLPSNGTTVNLMGPATKIAPPTTNPSFFQSRFFIQDRVSLFGFDFDGSGGALSGPTSINSVAYSFNACWFRNFSGRGAEMRGTGFFSGCFFNACAEACLESLDFGLCQVNDTHLLNSQTGYRASYGGSIIFGSGSLVSAEDISEEMLNPKGSRIVDESVRHYYDNVRDVCFMQRGGHYIKVNAPLRAISSFGSPTRNVFRLVGGNLVELITSGSQDLTPVGSYFRLNGTDVSLTQYEDNDYAVQDEYGNNVHDATATGL